MAGGMGDGGHFGVSRSVGVSLAGEVEALRGPHGLEPARRVHSPPVAADLCRKQVMVN